MPDTPTVLDGPTLGALVIAAITDLYAIIGHNGLTDAQSHGIVGLVTIVFVVGAFVYHAVKVHAFFTGPASYAAVHAIDLGDGSPVDVTK